MNVLEALCLGALQGITEFLPISSSGHLVLAQHLLGFQESQLFFDIAVHVGTLMAVFLVFRGDLALILGGCLRATLRKSSSKPTPASTGFDSGVKMALMILVGSIPTAFIGLLLRDVFDRFFASPAIVALGLWSTGFFLLWSRWSKPNRRHLENPGVFDALLIGLIQGAAITPGLSRSGVTITTGMLLGLRPDLAFRFSFLLSIPAILGALASEAFHISGNYPEWHVAAAGFFAAFLVGWLALHLLRSLVGKGKLFYFAPYCFVLGAAAFLIAFL
ncbi:MAG: undecaprenyl-diphosphate phosphatase [Deltaproteobacteria bacterium]|nr:MAG: undecaprenyl-diphosphate phosphatase [Deltaproteobacteria bacterium]